MGVYNTLCKYLMGVYDNELITRKSQHMVLI